MTASAILPIQSLTNVPADAGPDRPDATRVRTAAPSAPAGKAGEAFRQFESFVLQSFIETMLPKNAESLFGKGTAGAMWKSMLAEKLADQISRSGGIGIAQRIAAGPGAESLPAPAATIAPSASGRPQSGVPEHHGEHE